MDGDAIGGVVDLVTRRAPTGGLREVDLSGGWDEQAEARLGAGSFALGERFADDRLGLPLSASMQEAPRNPDRLEARYDGGALERVELHDYALTRERRGVAAGLDYSTSPATEIFARGFFSSLATDELRRVSSTSRTPRSSSATPGCVRRPR